MRLQQKLLAIILPLILIPIAVLVFLGYKYTHNVQDVLEDSKLRSDINSRVRQVDFYTSNATKVITFFADNDEFKKALTSSKHSDVNQKVLAEFNNFSAIYSDALYITLRDKQGQVITSSKPSNLMLSPLSLSNKPKWQLISNNAQEPLIEFQQPVFKQLNYPVSELLGFINVVIKPTNWTKQLDLFEQQGDKFMISDLAGNLLFSYPQGEMGSSIPPNVFKKLYNASSNQRSSTFKLGSNHIYFSGQIMSDRYLFIYGQNKDFVQQNESQISWIAGIVILLTIIITSLLVHFFIQSLVVVPIQQLAEAKQKVAQGQFDIKLNVDTLDEFGELFAAFNVMVRQLVVYREKERDGRLRLEYKVKERTEELLATNVALESSNKELEKAKQSSEQASELKSAFVANMSHEIRTPLTAILGFTEQVIADSPRNRHQLDLLGRVLRSGRHLLALINNILDVSKIEADKLDVDVTKVNIFDLFEDVVSLLSTQANEKKLQFDFHYIYPMPQFIRTDSTRLKQILLNLASNAIKFTEQGSIHIDVKYLAVEQKIEVVVTDTGIGMTPDVAHSLFQPFMQADVSISRRFGGTGLGLVISKNLACLLGGDINVTSELGKGSQFVLTIDVIADHSDIELKMVNSQLDLAQDKGKVFGFEAQSNVDDMLNKEVKGRVLVAEDVEDNQYLFKLFLDGLTLDYDIVSNGEQAVEKALTEDYDLILMDMQMPVMDGLEATTLLRQAGMDVPIYALTANVMKEDLEKHLAAGCTGTIAKPIDKEEFMLVVKTELSNAEEVEYSILSSAKLEQLKLDYVSQLPAQNTLISQHLKLRDLLGLMAEMHKIKGTAGSYGFMELSKLAGEIETFCGKNKDSDLFWPDVEARIFTLLQTVRNIIHAETTH